MLSWNKSISEVGSGMAEEFNEVREEFEKFREEMKNPLVVGALLNKLSEERASTNLLIREINAKLDKILALEQRLTKIEEKLTKPQKEAKRLLPDIDEEIMDFVEEKGKASAEEVMKNFKYKGKNAASARLNNLFKQGLLEKKQAGKTVYFLPVS